MAGTTKRMSVEEGTKRATRLGCGTTIQLAGETRGAVPFYRWIEVNKVNKSHSALLILQQLLRLVVSPIYILLGVILYKKEQF